MPLSNLLGNGGAALDGSAGSLCPAEDTLAFKGLAPCKGGLACAALLNGPLASSGLGYCTPQITTTPTSPSPLDIYSVAQRSAVGGAKCRLPAVYLGSLLLDCNTFGNDTWSCYTSADGAARPTECLPAGSNSTVPLQTLLSTPSGSDGLPGSLCSVEPSPIPDLATIPCKDPLMCEPLAGPMTGMGLGYCTARLAPAPIVQVCMRPLHAAGCMFWFVFTVIGSAQVQDSSGG